jgi:hypothetical protein
MEASLASTTKKAMLGATVLAALALLAGCSGDSEELRAMELTVAGRTHLTVDPGLPRRPLLVLLHGRGMRPKDLLWKELYDELQRLDKRAPALLLVDGGEHSYYHDRRDLPGGRIRCGRSRRQRGS